MIEPAASVHWRRSPQVAWVADAERAVLLNLESNAPQPEALTGTAAAIWAHLGATPLSLEGIVERLATEYAVAPDAIRADVEAFLNALRAKGFAESSPAF
jgi:hypothetical protein